MRRFLVLVFCLSTLAAAQTKAPQPKVTLAQPQIQAGRYQMFVNTELGVNGTFLLDTQTGKLWHRVQFTDIAGQPFAWVPQLKFDSEQEVQAWASLQKTQSQALAEAQAEYDAKQKATAHAEISPQPRVRTNNCIHRSDGKTTYLECN